MYRSVVYARLGNAQRVRLHHRLGERLEGGYREQARAIVSTLAHHFEQGGATQRAISYWQQAGENAARRNIHHEAVAGLRKGLVLLATLPDSSERAQQELTLQLSLGELLMAAKGFASPEAGDAYTRAHALCQQVRETPQHLRVLWGLILCRGAQGQLGTADELSQQLLHLAQRQPEAGFLMEGHFAVGRVAFYRGDFIAARTHLEQSLRLSDILQSPTPSLRGGFVPGVTPLLWLVQVLWALGDADQAQQRSQETLTLARRADHSPSLALAAAYASMLSQLRRDVTATQVHVDALMTLAAAEGFALRFEQGRMLGGWALAMRGDAITGVAHIRQGLAAYQGLGPELLRPYWLGLLAEAYSRAGQPGAGLQVLAEALTLVATTGARWWEAELHRLKGELLLQLLISDAHQAEAVFHQALDVARCQEAKALELRVVLSLSRLWQRWGRHDEARQLLAPIYGWFTEGFETLDLQEAKVQLETLARLES